MRHHSNDSASAPTASSQHQHTLAREGFLSGVGIHTGKTIELRLRPAPVNTGVVLHRVDAGGVEIPALATEVSSVELATTVGRDDVTVSTIEHMMAALRVAGVDNVIVELNGPEIPILDGSALPFLRLIDAVGTVAQPALRKVIEVTAPIEVESDGRRIRLEPAEGFELSYVIDFPNAAIGRQELSLTIDRKSFERELAAARTFALEAAVSHLKDLGLGQGGAADNCVIFGDDGPLNTDLRFADEPVRHKALDAVGDLALLGAPLEARVEVERGGHHLHYLAVEALLANPDCWRWKQPAPGRSRGRGRRRGAGQRPRVTVPTAATA